MGSRPAAIFVGDAPGLDFLNSLATPVDTAIDWIDDGAGLVDWLGQARLVPAEVLHSVRARARPGELDKVAAQARQLREWFRGFVSEHRGRRLAPQALGELEPLNRLLERDARFSRIVLRQDSRPAASLELQEMRPWRSPDELLMPIKYPLTSYATFITILMSLIWLRTARQQTQEQKCPATMPA